MRYFIGREGRQLGPFTEQQVRDQLSAGLIGPADLFWCEGMPEWRPVRTRFGGADTPPPRSAFAPPPLPAAGRTGATSSFASRPGQASAPAFKLASREARLFATSIDHLFAIAIALPGLLRISRALAGPLQAMILQPEASSDLNQIVAQLRAAIFASLPALAVPLLLLATIQFVLLAHRGQTLGKLLCKIRIVRTGGAPAGFVRVCLLRTLSMGLIAAIPVIGWLISGVDPLLIFREDRRCLHDLIADTTVIDA